MNNMKVIIALIICIAGFTSCLQSNLEEQPAYTDADISDSFFEYRYDITRSDGVKEGKFVRLNNIAKNINQNFIDITLEVPLANASFPSSERAKVSLTNIALYCYLSNAAKIEPINGAPKMGTIGDFSSPVTYRITAADGKTVKTWTITAKFNKPIN